jgi:hypothetical protein
LEIVYKSPISVGQRQPVPIDTEDPRLSNLKIGPTIARQGAAVLPINFTGNTLASNVQQSGAGLILPSADAQPVATFNQIAGVLNPNYNLNNNINAPDGITNLSASWSGSNFVITWTFDAAASQNQYAADFAITFTIGLTKYIIKSYNINKSSSTQTYTFTYANNTTLFGFFQTTFDSLTVSAEDYYGNAGSSQTITPTSYVNSLPAPTISLSSISGGYSVSFTDPNDTSLQYISIEEYVSTASSEPTGVTYKQVYLSAVNPAIIITPTTDKRWVKARFTDKAGTYSSYSVAQPITPTPIVAVNATPPTEVTVGTISWSGTNIIIPYTLPSTNAGVRFLIKLTAPNSQIGYFYFFTDGTSNLNQTHTISSTDLYLQFGAYYSSYFGTFISYSSVDSPSTGVSITVPARANGLATVTPTPTIVSNFNGYNATFNFSTVPATYAEIYQKYTNTAWVLNPPDAVTMSYLSGGASGATTITVNTVKDNDGNTLTSIQDGYLITGNNIPANTYVSSVSGTSPTFTLTLSNALTGQASGTYSMQGLVWSGPSPANIFSNLYIPTYVVVRYYDNFGNSSLLSNSATVTPINPSLSLIQNAVQVGGTAGAIYVGSSASSGARILLGVDSYYNTGNNSYSGIFAYDGSATTNTAPTTSIISNASNGEFTFKTVNAKIADWTISTNKIESTLISGITKYTGLSASNTNYAFWAGATSAGNSDDSAPFSVTPLGAVKASNITISGGQLDVGATSSNLTSGFHVTDAGLMYATGAVIDGSIKAQSGTFVGNVQITTGSLYAGSLTGAKTVMNPSGFAAYSAAGSALTEILTAPLGSQITTTTTSNGNTIPVLPSGLAAVNMITSAAVIGGWIINGYQITSDANNAVTLDSSARSITLQGTFSSTNYKTGIAAPITPSSNVIYAGINGNPNFAVNAAGIMTAQGAIIQSSGSYYVKIDGANDQLLIYGLPTTNPGSTQSFSAVIAGGGIGGQYTSVATKTSSPYTLTAKAGNISSSSYLSLVSGTAVQIFGTSDNTPMASFDPTGSSTQFYENGSLLSTGSASVINTNTAFLNSSFVVLGNGYNVDSYGNSTESSSNVKINGWARIRNGTPVGGTSAGGNGTGSYIRNVYIRQDPTTGTPNGGFQGDIWITY